MFKMKTQIVAIPIVDQEAYMYKSFGTTLSYVVLQWLVHLERGSSCLDVRELVFVQSENEEKFQ